jgi:hypothetical protein
MLLAKVNAYDALDDLQNSYMYKDSDLGSRVEWLGINL